MRKAGLRKRSLLDAVRSGTPLMDPLAIAQERGLDSIDKNATIVRRLIVPMIVVATGMLAAIPLLSSVPATIVSAVVAVIAVILGMAARPLIENAMSGLVISYSKLVNLGDTVRVEDVYGTIEDITITHTTIKAWDWRRYIVPNSKMIQHSFFNYSVIDKYEWAYVDFWVSYEDDFELVDKIACDVPKQSKYFAAHDAPQVWVMELAPEGMRCWLAAWANTPSEAWYLRNDMRTGLVRELRKHGIRTHLRRHEVAKTPAEMA